MRQRFCSINDAIVQDSIPNAFNSWICNFIFGDAYVFLLLLLDDDGEFGDDDDNDDDDDDDK